MDKNDKNKSKKKMKEKTIGFFGESLDKPRQPPDLTKFGALPGSDAWRKMFPKKNVNDK
jgi:hypothetical protein